jgi:hypothetical protein
MSVVRLVLTCFTLSNDFAIIGTVIRTCLQPNSISRSKPVLPMVRQYEIELTSGND